MERSGEGDGRLVHLGLNRRFVAPLRILRIITRMNVGGPSLHVSILTTRLEDDFESLLVTGVASHEEGDMLTLRPDLAGALEGRIRVLKELRRDPKAFDDLRVLRGLRSVIREFRPHIVHTHLAKAGTLGRLAAILEHVPLRVHTYHGTVFAGHFRRPVAGAITVWERFLARGTHCLIAVSPGVADDLRARGFPAHKIRTVRLGLDLDRFQEVPALTEPRPHLLVVARLAPVKDIPLFLDAFEKLRTTHPHVTADIVGDGPLRSELARQAPSGVTFLGNRADLPELLTEAGAVVLTSRSEGSPVALIEALAAGRPVVGPAVGGVSDVLGGRRAALVVDSRDPAAFAAAFARVLDDPEIRAAAAAERATVIEKYGAERLVREIAALYRELWGDRAVSQ